MLVLRDANSHRGGGDWGPDDYDVFDGNRDVGRIFRDANERWFWGVDFMLTHRKSYGTAGTLEEAKAAFKTEYECWQRER